MTHNKLTIIVALLLSFTALLSPTVKANNAIYTIHDDILIINEGVTELTKEDLRGVRDRQIMKVQLPSSLKKIGKETFMYNSHLESINLPSSLIEIGDSAFYQCCELKNIDIPITIPKIGTDAFYGCKKINKLIYYDYGRRCYGWVGEKTLCTNELVISNDVIAINDYAFYNTELEHIVLPEGLESIGKDAFPYSLEEINIPNTVEYIGDFAINTDTKIDNKSKLLLYANNTKCYGWIGDQDSCPEKLVLPEGITYINKNAFNNNNTIKEIHFPESLKNINASVLSNCENLETVVLSKELNSIGYRAFANCDKLKNINIPDKCDIDDEAFQSCDLLNFLLLSHNGTMCNGCTNKDYFGQIVIPSSVVIISPYAFRDCYNIKEFILPEGLQTIGERAFEECQSIEKFVMPNSVRLVGDNLFNNCIYLKEVQLSNSLSSISSYMFSNCRSLENIEIPASVTEINEHAFEECTRLKSINIPENVQAINPYTFSGCSSLESIQWPSKPISISYYAFYNCKNLSIEKLPKGTKVNRDAFGISKLTYYTEEIAKIQGQIFAILLFLIVTSISAWLIHNLKEYSWKKSIKIVLLVELGIAILLFICLFILIMLFVKSGYHG
ncbi:MAG: leucine-rich repeat domain-containing protein [Bacteroidales bacterium]|nr:leucine-rich repeat domain-containing protein [Bacteroidales bacterium]